MATISAREFNQDVSAAKRAAVDEPVVITDRGSPSFVLLSIAAYERLVGAPPSLLDALSMPDDTEEIEVDFPRLDLSPRVPEL